MIKKLDQLALDLGYILIRNNESKCEPLLDNMNVAGNIIWVGDYNNKEYELISFFHEVGHSKISKGFLEKWRYNTLLIEIECWNIGIDFARKLDIFFSDEAINFGYKKALSYVGHDKRECCNWEKTYKNKLWVYK